MPTPPVISQTLVQPLIDVVTDNLVAYVPLVFTIMAISFGFWYVIRLGKKLLGNLH